MREILAAQPDVLVAYLFGSRARGTHGPMSDVDVAVLLPDGADAHARRLDLIDALEGADVVVLNDAPSPLAFRVLRDGQLILSRDEAARVRFHFRVLRDHMDTAPLRSANEAALASRVAEGRFGRP